MISLNKLKEGDIVDIIAPSSYVKQEDWKKSFEILKNWGLKPRLFDKSLDPSKSFFHSNTDKKRFYFLKKAFQNSDSKAIWSLRGGYGSQKLMDEFCKISIKNKIFIGFSDVTAIHLYLNGIKKIPTVHAPNIVGLKDMSKKNLKILKDLLFEKKYTYSINNIKSLQKKDLNIKASLIGGNLSVVQSSIGSRYFSSFRSKILFLEDVNEELYSIDRMLHHLLYSGSLKGVKALILGSFHHIKNKDLETKILKPFSNKIPFPIFMNLPSGHHSFGFPLIFGLTTSIQHHQSKNKTILSFCHL